MNKLTPTCIPCGVRTFLRNTYFNGKLLVERDFKDEQAYLIGKDWLHNSLLHGLGTVCGLKVLAHPNPECQDKYVYIEPGVALDCCGREIIVTEKLLVPILDLIKKNDVDADEEGRTDLFISLCYEEAGEEKIPVILPDCDCADGNETHNRVREGYRLHLFSQPAGIRQPVRPSLRAKLDWEHTITLSRQSPRAVAVDHVLQQLYVAAQMLPDPDEPEEGDEALAARLYAFRTDTHDLVTAVSGGQNPTDLALSLLGDLIFLATDGLPGEPVGEGEPTATAGIAVFRESDIRTDTEPAAIIDLGEPARLVVSPHTGALFALLPESGELRAWSEESIRDWLDEAEPPLAGPTPVHTVPNIYTTTSDAALQGGAVLSVTLNGRYCFIADPDNSVPTRRVRVVDVAQLFSDNPDAEITPEIDLEDRPIALATSRDSAYLYVLWDGQGDNDGSALLTRYELLTETAEGPLVLHRDGVGGQWMTEPLDLSLAPDERWAYVLQSDGAQSQVQAISIDVIAGPAESDEKKLLGTRENVSGTARYERLAILGERLYVAADDEATDVQPERGLVAILDVEEAACDGLFHRALEGCPACGDNENEGHCVILAHISEYQLNASIKNPDEAGEDDNSIDNLTHRPMVPSSNNIVEVIRCMLEQGIAEGIPGPRGPAGEQGQRGSGITETGLEEPAPGPGDQPTVRLEPITNDPEGDQKLILGIPPGQRGPGITEADLEEPGPGPGDQPTVRLESIPNDPEGDQKLILGIPPGQRGPGITEAELEEPGPGPGDQPTVRLEPIPNDPEGDQKLILGIPPATDEPVPKIFALSWKHDHVMPPGVFQEFLVDPDIADLSPREKHLGLVIMFDSEINMSTILKESVPGNPEEPTRSEVFQLYARIFEEGTGLFCECLIPRATHMPVEVLNIDVDDLITEIAPKPGAETAKAVRLVFAEKNFPKVFDRSSLFVRVVLRADFVLDLEGRGVDGNFIGAMLPTGNGRQGDTFESWLRMGDPDII